MMFFKAASFLVLASCSSVASANFNSAVSVSAVDSSGKDAETDEMNANPIRRVVSLLQGMAKKIEAEGKKEEELYDKFVCYCKNGAQQLGDSISANTAEVPQLQSDIEEAESKLAATKQELEQHQTDREAAKKAMATATAVREKEHEAYLKESSEMKSNINALGKAIPAIEKGMAGGFLQTDAAAIVRRVALQDSEISDFDREALTAFLQGSTAGSESYVPKSDQIVGILKTMKEEFEKDLASVEAAESEKVSTYEELMAAKTKEVQAHTDAIERKSALIGELSVSIVHMKNSLSDAEESLIEDQKFLADLDTNCALKKKEWDERVKTRGEELVAIQDTIKILNDDDALDLFKKTLPSPSLLQVRTFENSKKLRALAILRKAKQVRETHNRVDIDFIALALGERKVDFTKVIKMIDDMVALLAKEQADDDHKQEYCKTQLDLIEDKGKELQHKIDNLESSLADTEEDIKSLTEDLKALDEGVKALDKSVLEATQQRKKENGEYQDLMSGNMAAKELLEFAKNRLNKFYNPKLYKPPPKRELSEEERITLNMGGTLAPTNPPGGIAGTGVTAFKQTGSSKDAPPPPPETFGAYQKKGEESTGVLSMIDLLVRDLDKEMTEAETEEKDAQKDYEAMMDDAAKKRAGDVKAIAEKSSAKADAETALAELTESHKVETSELAATKEYEHSLHNECDWLLENFDIRKEARAQETDALKNAKAILSGADFSFVQKH